MKKPVLASVLFCMAGLLFADLEADTAPVTVPVFYPYSDSFFASRFQSASMASPLPGFFFFDIIGDLLYIPKSAEVTRNDTSSKAAVRFAGALGGKLAINDYCSGMAGISFVMDSIYIASSYNLFAAAGLFVHREFFGLDFGIGAFGGYYWNDFRQLPEKPGQPGMYEGVLDAQTPVTTNAARFIVTPVIGMSDTGFFLESLGGSVNVTEDLSTGSILGDLAFKTIRALFINLDIDLYYKSNWYNLYMKDRLLGACFAAKYLSINLGYRWFEPVSDISFLPNYQDGLYGKAIVKFPAMGVNILLSYGFETTFQAIHYIGIGVTLPVDGWRNDYLYEFAGNSLQNMRFSGSNVTGW